MAKVDVKSPSEDEDFDVKADENETSAAAEETTKDPSTSEDVTATTESSDGSDDDDAAKTGDEATSEEETPEETAEEAPADVSLSPEEPETPVEDEAPAESVTPESEPEPEATPEPEAMPATAPPASAKKKGSTGRAIFEIILVAIIVGLGVWGWGLRADRSNLEAQVIKLNANPQATVQKQAQDLITQVGKLMQLPTGEQPTIANVSDVTQAKKQSAFFNNAQNGDKVLMYVKAGEAILYRPSTNKIILVAPLTFNSAATGSTPATTTKTTQ